MANGYVQRGGSAPIQGGIVDAANVMADRDWFRKTEVDAAGFAKQHELAGAYGDAAEWWHQAVAAALEIVALQQKYPTLPVNIRYQVMTTAPSGRADIILAGPRSLKYIARRLAALKLQANPPGSPGFDPSLLDPSGLGLVSDSLPEGLVPGAGLSPVAQIGLVGLVFGLGWLAMRVFKIR